MYFFRYSLSLALSICALTACGSDAAAPSSTTPSASAGDTQTPPSTNGADVETWLKAASYKDWSCETATHPQMKVSPHGHNRICSNDLIASFTGASGDERPKGSAAVKELYDDADKLVGYAVEVKVAETSDEGKNWYWYERVPLSSAAPHDSKGVVADGIGSAGPALSICVSCHSAAGSDDPHTVTKSGDFVYDVIN